MYLCAIRLIKGLKYVENLHEVYEYSSLYNAVNFIYIINKYNNN